MTLGSMSMNWFTDHLLTLTLTDLGHRLIYKGSEISILLNKTYTKCTAIIQKLMRVKIYCTS